MRRFSFATTYFQEKDIFLLVFGGNKQRADCSSGYDETQSFSPVKQAIGIMSVAVSPHSVWSILWSENTGKHLNLHHKLDALLGKKRKKEKKEEEKKKRACLRAPMQRNLRNQIQWR